MNRLIGALILATLLWTPTPSWAAWAWVKTVATQTETITAASQTTVAGPTIAAGNHAIIYAVRSANADTLASITSTASGYVASLDINVGTTFNGIYSVAIGSIYFPNGMSASETITVNWTEASAFDYFSILVEEYSGLATTSWTDQTAIAQAFRTQAQGVTSGSTGTTTATDELIFGIMMIDDSAETLSAGSGYTKRGGYSFAGPGLLVAAEDKNGATLTTYEVTGSWVTGNKTELGAAVTYKAAVASTPTNYFRLRVNP